MNEWRSDTDIYIHKQQIGTHQYKRHIRNLSQILLTSRVLFQGPVFDPSEHQHLQIILKRIVHDPRFIILDIAD